MHELVKAIENLSNKTVFDYFVGFSPLVLSLVAIYISVDSTRKQNKIALLEKRLLIYTELKMCISKVIAEGKVTTQNANLFIIKARDVKFIFDSKLDELCNEIYKSMLELRYIEKRVEEGINSSYNVGDHIENCDREAILLENMLGYSKQLEEAFYPHISIKKIKKHRKQK